MLILALSHRNQLLPLLLWLGKTDAKSEHSKSLSLLSAPKKFNDVRSSRCSRNHALFYGRARLLIPQKSAVEFQAVAG